MRRRAAPPPILLLHGNSGSSRTFRHQLEGELGARFRLVAFDLPGHGASDRAADPERTYTVPGYVDVLVEVVHQMDIPDAVFAGWSLGGHVVLEAAGRLPDASGFLIYGAPPIAIPPAMEQAFLPNPAMAVAFRDASTEEEVQAFLAAWLKPGTPVPETFLADFRQCDGRARAALGASVGAAKYRDEVGIVGSLPKPLAVLHGAHEQLVNRAYLDALSMPTLWRGAVQEVPDAGHATHWERPEAFDALVGAFVHDCRK